MTEDAKKNGIEIDLSDRPVRKLAVTLLAFATLFGAGYALGALLARIF
ncbi:hypothetical protein [Sphingomicrobium arenosum]|nr:hypothetical protein [Sphingomicrobium arenosum]